MLAEALKIPNRSHPDIIHGPEKCAKKVEICGEKKKFKEFKVNLADFTAQEKGLNMLRLKNMNLAHGGSTLFLELVLYSFSFLFVYFKTFYVYSKR